MHPDEPDPHDEINQEAEKLQADMMVNVMVRIAKDLERVLGGIWACAGLLGMIAFLIFLRLLHGW